MQATRTSATRQVSAVEPGARLALLNAEALERALDADGYVLAPRLLDAPECAAIAELYDDQSRFR